jgi:hypothetical protein
MQLKRRHIMTSIFAFAPLLALPAVGEAATVTNPICPTEVALFNPGGGSDIVVPPGFKVSVFAAGLNFPTGIAFLGNSQRFQVFVLESGHGLPSICNEQGSIVGGEFSSTNPFTPDILVFNQNGGAPTRRLGKPTAPGVGFQPAGPGGGDGSAPIPVVRETTIEPPESTLFGPSVADPGIIPDQRPHAPSAAPSQPCAIGYFANISSTRLNAFSAAARGVIPPIMMSAQPTAQTCSFWTWA